MQDASKKVGCILDCIERTGFFFNPHIYPQAYLFDTWTDWGLLDLSLIVFDISDISAVVQILSGRKGHVHARESKHGKIAMDELDPALIERICKLFAVDTTLIHLLGMHDPNCMVSEKLLRDSIRAELSPDMF
jgi:hypothetical protein